MTAHAEISPSSLNYRQQCRQWETRQEESLASIEGTLMHAAMEADNCDALDGEQLGVYDTVQAFLKPLQAGAVAEHREIRLAIKLGTHETFGTCDRFILRPGGLAHLIDFKFGRLSVPEANVNLQALAYAVGAFDAFPLVHRIQAWLLTPRRDEASSVVLERAHLYAYRAKLEKLFDELTVDSPATPCEACSYCAKLATCPAIARSAVAVAQRYDLDMPAILMEVSPSKMSTQMLDTVAMPVARVMDRWVSSVKAELTERAMAGEPLTRHTLAERAKAVTIDDANAAYAAVRDMVSLDAFHGAVSVSLSKLKSAARSAAPRGKKDAAEEEIFRRLSAAGVVQQTDNEQQTIRYLRKK